MNTSYRMIRDVEIEELERETEVLEREPSPYNSCPKNFSTQAQQHQ
jgi:hypothetical protein